MSAFLRRARRGRTRVDLRLLGSACLAILAGFSATTACGGEDACSEDSMLRTPAFTLAYEDAVSGGSCTIDGVTVRDDGDRRAMDCAPEGDYCLCVGGDLPGDYEVIIYDVFDHEEVDRAEVRVTEDPSNTSCRDAVRTDDAGAAGAGGEGGAAGSGGG